MRAASPGIKLVCVGGTRDHWRKAVLAGCALNVDLLSEKCCSDLRDTPAALMQSLTENVRECTLAYRSLVQTMPEMKDRAIRLAICQWGFVFEDGGGGMAWRHGLGIAAGIHQFIRDSDVLGLAAYTSAIGPNGAVCVSDGGACLTPAGLLLSLYRNHFGTEAVAVNEECAPLDIVAARSADSAALTVAVVNPLEEEASIQLSLPDDHRIHAEMSWVVTAPSSESVNIPGGESPIVLEQRPFGADADVLPCPPLSVTIFRLRVE